MKQLFEAIPVVIFVGVYFSTKDIYLATALLMAGLVMQVAFEYWQDRQVSKRTQLIFWVVIVAGVATLAFRDELFIKWKPTIVNWLFCLALLASQHLGTENLLKKMLAGQISLPDKVWRNLSYGWSAGFFLAGALNLVVAYLFSTGFWVTYKLLGGFGITLCYLVITGIYLIRGGYIREEAKGEQTPAKAEG